MFKGLWNNEQSIKSIEGIDIAWVEEAQTVSKKSIDVLTPTVRKPNSKIVYTYNRLLEEDPIHTRLVLEGRPDTIIINENYDIAIKYGMMPDVILKEIEDDKKNRPGLYKHKWLGEPSNMERKIYKDWAIVDDIPHEAKLKRYGLNFGYSNHPLGLVALYYYNGGYIIDEILYGRGISNQTTADTIKNLPEALIVADSAEPKSIDEIKSYNIQIVGCKKQTLRIFGKPDNPGSKESYRNWSIKIVQNERISVTKRSVNVIREYRNYLWIEDKEGKITTTPEEPYHYIMDAIRYGIVSLAPVINKQNFLNNIPIINREEEKVNPAR